MALLQTFRSFLLMALVTALALTFAFAGAASAQLEELQEQCPPEFPLCPEGEEEAPDDDFGDDDFGDDDFGDDALGDDPQVQETPEGAVAAGTGAPTSGSALPLLVLATTLGLATVAGLAARRRLATDA